MNLATLITSILPQARFSVPGTDKNWNLGAYQQQYHASRSATGIRAGLQSVISLHAVVEVPETAARLFEQLVDTIRNMLEPHVDPETSRITFSTNLPVSWSRPEPELDLFCKQIIRCAALVGTGRAIELLEGCIRGDTVPCTHVTILEGVHLERQCLEVCDGIRLEQLSKDPNQLVNIVPDMLFGKLFPDAFAMITDRSGWLTGTTALFKESTATLSICSPRVGGGFNRHFDQSLVPDRFLLQAVSLACDSYVVPTWQWFNFERGLGPLTGCDVSLPTNFVPENQHGINSYSESTKLTQQDVDVARHLYDRLLGQSSEPKVQIAFERWHSSKARKSDIVNNAIDIRIALEALFAEGGNAELSHRVALRGAWYLGKSVAEREKYFKMLKKVYNLGSKAVHAGRLDSDNASISLLDDARSICRSALIRYIQDGVKRDSNYWNSLVLGDSD